MKAVRVLLLCGMAATASAAFAEDYTTLSGREYKGVSLSRVEPDGLVVMTSEGIEKIPFTDLPDPVRKQHGYDKAKATVFLEAQTKAETAQRAARAKTEAQRMKAAAAAQAQTDAAELARKEQIAAANAQPQEPEPESYVSPLAQPDRQKAVNGPQYVTGNPLERGAMKDPITISGKVIQNLQGSLLLGTGRYYSTIVMITGLPDDYMVADGTPLKVRVNPDSELTQYTTVLGATSTVRKYTAVALPR